MSGGGGGGSREGGRSLRRREVGWEGKGEVEEAILLCHVHPTRRRQRDC